MQINVLTPLKKASRLRQLATLLKVFLLGALLIFVFKKVETDRENWISLLNILQEAVHNGIYWVLFMLALVLMPLNWFFEAKKWQLLASKVNFISVRQAFKGVLAGLSLGLVSVPTLGDLLGRIGLAGGKHKEQLVSAILLGQFAQFIFTFGWGALGVYYFSSSYLKLASSYSLFLSLLMLVPVVCGLGFLFNMEGFVKLFWGWIRKWPRIEQSLTVLALFSKRDVLEMLVWAGLRHLVFTLQFVLVFALFKVDLPLMIILAGVMWIFVSKSVIPVFSFMVDLGVREFSALLFFSAYPVDNLKIVSACLLVWLINKLLPSIAGTLIVFKMKPLP